MIALLLLLAAAPGPASVDASRGFRHETHLALENGKLQCGDCHATSAEKEWRTERPGKNDHAPCDTCHAAEYYQEPGEYCRICHLTVDPLKRGASPLRDYPRRGPEAQLVSAFDHRLHLEREGAACAGCHRVEGTGSPYVGIPQHADCARCHGDQAQPPMSDCRGCHAREGHTYARSFASNDIHFTHAKHLFTRDGAAIDCERCHADVRSSGPTTRLKLPRMRDCGTCHDDASVTGDGMRMWRCALCHLDPELGPPPVGHTTSLPIARAGFFARLAPLVMLPLAEGLRARANEAPLPAASPAIASGASAAVVRASTAERRQPEDHTLLFRTRHAAAAAAPDARCSYCHTGLSESSRDSCNDCHLVTRPRSHDLRFSGPRHGRLAAAKPESCATCHSVDYCTDCHSIAPSNHFPLTAFMRLHAPRARADSRACLTCHSFETTCERCHSIDGVPR